MKTKKLVWLVLPVLLVSCATKPVLPTEEDAKKVIMEKVSSAAERWSSGDPMGYVEMAATDITYMDDIAASELLIGKEDVEAYMKSLAGQVPQHTAKLSSFHWQYLGDLVLLTYRYQGVFGEVAADPWKVTSVFRYMDGDWLSVHENWSLVKPAEEEQSDMEDEPVDMEEEPGDME